MSVMLCPCIFCGALLMYMFVLFVACLTLFVNCLVKQFAMCLGVVALCCLMLWICLVWLEVLCWIYRVCSSTECAYASKCSFHIFCLCFCMSEVISSFKSLRGWRTCVCSPYDISLDDFTYYVVG